jgi:DNA-binding NarL/FixJ family response regulator
MRKKLLIVDDHVAIRNGLIMFLEDTEFAVVGEASTATTALLLAKGLDIDVILLDGKLPDHDGLSVLSEIKKVKPFLPVLMYSLCNSESFIRRCRELGASGYIAKGGDVQTLLQALRQVAAGQFLWPEEEPEGKRRAAEKKDSARCRNRTTKPEAAT